MTFFLSFLFLLQTTETNQTATGNLTEKLLLPVVCVFVGAIFSGAVAWYLYGGKAANRRADATLISQLQKDVDLWIEKLTAMRRESQKIEDLNREIKQNCKEENNIIYNELEKLLRVTSSIEANAFEFPEYVMLRRDMIRVNERLGYLKNNVNKLD